MRVSLRRIILVIVCLLVLAALVVAFLPEPIPIDLLDVTRGPLSVTVDEEGVTRIRERYVVSAPLAGRLRRIDLDPGDSVEAVTTAVAIIEPTDPQLLDARARAEAEARVLASEAAVSQSEAKLGEARSSFDFAENDLAKIRDAFERGASSPRELDEKAVLRRNAMESYRAAQFAADIARYELELARSALLHTTPRTDPDAPVGESAVRFPILAPISGRVLRVFQESVAVVAPGTPLLEIGDPADLELVIDVLSTDAVRILPGAEVIIEHWGGDEPLAGRVRLVEPSAFTKISALGVEEQRVNVIADFVTPIAERPTLGDGYRVEGRIVTWDAEDVVRVPTAALFREDGAWAVYVVEAGRATLRTIEVGKHNGLIAEVREGLAADEQVIAHPSDRVTDGIKVIERE
ncbi:MAG: HlyD family efflux transporter periplasmic adaptor subunit [Planctomycetes bacterium]|nr:HlyD family efflux transporter periplasmic adaptor subunit [Planctomycetota bacterium]